MGAVDGCITSKWSITWSEVLKLTVVSQLMSPTSFLQLRSPLKIASWASARLAYSCGSACSSSEYTCGYVQNGSTWMVQVSDFRQSFHLKPRQDELCYSLIGSFFNFNFIKILLKMPRPFFFHFRYYHMRKKYYSEILTKLYYNMK